MTRRRTLTKKQVATLLERHYGNLYHAAKDAGVSRAAIYSALKKWPELQEVRAQAQEEEIDRVESVFLRKCLDGDTACLIFFLKTRARHRGYVAKSDVNLSANLVVKIDWGDDVDTSDVNDKASGAS